MPKIRKVLATALLLLVSVITSNIALANSAVLDLLQVNSAIKSLDATIDAFVQHQIDAGNLSSADAKAVSNNISAKMGSKAVQRKLERYLANNASTLNGQVASLLNHPMADRVKTYQQKLKQTPTSKVDRNLNKIKRLGHSKKRSELIRRLNKAVPLANFAAIAQTAIEQAVAEAANQSISDGADRLASRNKQLISRASALNHYTYRFFSDQQLEDWVSRLEQDDIQRYVKQIRNGLAAALK